MSAIETARGAEYRARGEVAQRSSSKSSTQALPHTTGRKVSARGLESPAPDRRTLTGEDGGLRSSLTLVLPRLVRNARGNEQAKSAFTQGLRKIAETVHAQVPGKHVALAPLGGTRISAFKELNVDGLVLLDWSRPGSPADVQKAFGVGSAALRKSVQAALDGGGMDTGDVLASPMAAQILARLRAELGVSEVTVSSYALPGSRVGLAALSGEPLEASDPPLVTRFAFDWEGAPRELCLVSYRVSPDARAGRTPLPDAVLKGLVPGGFTWDYLSADGMAFFSGDEKNGLHGASVGLVEGLRPGGGVVLDYPRADYTKTGQQFDGITFMAGRAELESFGLQRLASLPAKSSVFGYTGHHPADEVRVYQKPLSVTGSVAQTTVVESTAPADAPATFDLGALQPVGAPTRYVLRDGGS